MEERQGVKWKYVEVFLFLSLQWCTSATGAQKINNKHEQGCTNFFFFFLRTQRLIFSPIFPFFFYFAPFFVPPSSNNRTLWSRKKKRWIVVCYHTDRISTFVSISFLIVGVSECLSLIVDDHVYTGGETRVNFQIIFFFFFFLEITNVSETFRISIGKFRTGNHHQHCGTRRFQITIRICSIRSHPRLPL